MLDQAAPKPEAMLLCVHPWRPCVYQVSLHLIPQRLFAHLPAILRRHQKLNLRIQIVQIGLESPLGSSIEAGPLTPPCLTHLQDAATIVTLDVYRPDQADLFCRQSLEEVKPQQKPLAYKPGRQIHFRQKVFTVVGLQVFFPHVTLKIPSPFFYELFPSSSCSAAQEPKINSPGVIALEAQQ